MLLLNRLRDHEAAEPLFHDALALARVYGVVDDFGKRRSLFGLGWSLYGQGRDREAEPLLHER